MCSKKKKSSNFPITLQKVKNVNYDLAPKKTYCDSQTVICANDEILHFTHNLIHVVLDA